jgi:hypothetical protein
VSLKPRMARRDHRHDSNRTFEVRTPPWMVRCRDGKVSRWLDGRMAGSNHLRRSVVAVSHRINCAKRSIPLYRTGILLLALG